MLPRGSFKEEEWGLAEYGEGRSLKGWGMARVDYRWKEVALRPQGFASASYVPLLFKKHLFLYHGAVVYRSFALVPAWRRGWIIPNYTQSPFVLSIVYSFTSSHSFVFWFTECPFRSVHFIRLPRQLNRRNVFLITHLLEKIWSNCIFSR